MPGLRSKIATIIMFVSIGMSCTIGFVSGDITTDGWPVIFKVRDIDAWNIEFKRVQPAYGYAYVANTYTTSSTAWMGLNEVGFGIVQSAANNFTAGSSAENGYFMTTALKNCATVAGFDSMVNATDTLTRYTLANYIVFDIDGNGAIYELSNDAHATYLPDTSGILVRANFALIGNSERGGIERQERALSLLQHARDVDSLNAEWICRNLVNDLHRDGSDPYPLPFTGRFWEFPTGWMETDSFGRRTIAGRMTVAASIITVPQGSDPALGHMYSYFAHPATSVPFVMFPNADDSPPYVTGEDSPMYELCRAKRDSAFSFPTDETLFDTWFLLDTTGNGVLRYKNPIEDWVFDTVRTVISSGIPTSSELTTLQDTITSRVYNWYRHGEITLGLNETPLLPESPTIHLHPNPFNASVHVASTSNSPIEVYDTRGRYIDRIIPPADWQPARNLPSGVFLLVQPGLSFEKAVFIR